MGKVISINSKPTKPKKTMTLAQLYKGKTNEINYHDRKPIPSAIGAVAGRLRITSINMKCNGNLIIKVT